MLVCFVDNAHIRAFALQLLSYIGFNELWILRKICLARHIYKARTRKFRLFISRKENSLEILTKIATKEESGNHKYEQMKTEGKKHN